MTLELIAPAKLNLTLEVLGRRADGYHEIASVMQTIDLADRVRLSESDSLELVVAGEQTLGVPLEGPRNLAYRAAQALAEAAGDAELGARIELEKRVPAGMGLGGGSSDAAAVLRGLDKLWHLNLGIEGLTPVAARVGSDVAFFLHGGSALVTGRGEVVEPIEEPSRDELIPQPDGWEVVGTDAIVKGQGDAFTLFVSDVELEDKTRRMYSELTPSDYTDGRRTHITAESLRRGLPLSQSDLINAFDRHIAEVAPPLGRAMALCRQWDIGVMAAGSGPGFFSMMPLDAMPETLLRELERDYDVRALACRALGREQALAVIEG